MGIGGIQGADRKDGSRGNGGLRVRGETMKILFLLGGRV